MNEERPATIQEGGMHRLKAELSQLATHCGFTGITQVYPSLLAADEQSVKNFLCQIRPPDLYNSTCHDLSDKIDDICAIVQSIKPRETLVRVPQLSSNCDDFEGRLEPDQLFLDYIYKTSFDDIPEQFSTPFGKHRDFFHGFFGAVEDIPKEYINIDTDDTNSNDIFYTDTDQDELTAHESQLDSIACPDSDELALAEAQPTVPADPGHNEVCMGIGPERSRKRQKCTQVVINFLS
jgi:hypothetical protein